MIAAHVFKRHMLPSYDYSYLVGVLIFWVAWIGCFILGKRYRSHIRWGTLVASPMALTSLLFVPQYWMPPSLFDLDHKIRVGIEDFLWAAAVGGIAAVVGEIFLRERLASIRRSRHKRHYTPFVLLAGVFIGLEVWRPQKTMDNTIISFAIGALVLAYLRRDLIPLMLIGTVVFAVLYFALFLAFSLYTRNSFSGTTIYRTFSESLLSAFLLRNCCLPRRVVQSGALRMSTFSAIVSKPQESSSYAIVGRAGCPDRRRFAASLR